MPIVLSTTASNTVDAAIALTDISLLGNSEWCAVEALLDDQDEDEGFDTFTGQIRAKDLQTITLKDYF